ncbi:MAG TPA: phosphoenolpyruvate--protein phosphotransferase [Spirochaetota bacterium]|nr:phosphoenolpyruvate--protein phosphotransferase [Spirochaetota bacterium]
MEIVEGIAASPGITIGEAFIYNQDLLIPKFSISERQVELEIDRFYVALRKTKEEYERLRIKIVEEMSEDEGKFLDAHILMTEDQSLIQEVVEKMRTEKKNVEWIIYQVVDSLVKKFKQMEDEYFRDRAIDILDIGRKLIQILLSHKNFSLADLSKDVIVVSTDLTVSDTASMNKKHVLGFVTELGGRTSHVAILAKALAIPAVLGLKDIAHKINTGDMIIVDGNSGKVIINPDEKTIFVYQKEKLNYEKRETYFLTQKDLPSVTLDGKPISLKANMEIPEQEIESVIYHGAEGIGLYRSEFLYLSKKRRILPTEDQQFEAYKFILEKFSDSPVTIRTLDLGGDKVLEGVTERELNPYLGWRAIRFCLSRQDIFKTQLRALYRASIFGNLKIMFPMITGLEEVHEVKKVVDEVKKDLKKENIKFKNDVPLGYMIETPAAALASDIIAKSSDFFSIGTNDLIQYTLACDRGNQKVAYLYQPLHPSVLKLIKIIIDSAHNNNIKVSLCGEMGSDLESVIVLIGLGVDELSMGPVSILEVKEIVRNIKYEEAKILAKELVTLNDCIEVKKRLNSWIKSNLKNLHFIIDKSKRK